MIIEEGTELGKNCMVFDCENKKLIRSVISFNTETKEVSFYVKNNGMPCIENGKIKIEKGTFPNYIAINCKTQKIVE